MLEDLRQKIAANQIGLHEALATALPSFRGKLSDERIMWLANEMQGYRNATDWYQNPTPDFPPYRVVTGELKVMDRQGNLAQLNHPMANRTQFFLAAPIAWLEDSVTLPGSITMVEMAELNAYMGKLAQGTVVLHLTKDQVQALLANFKRSLLAVIDDVNSRMPKG